MRRPPDLELELGHRDEVRVARSHLRHLIDLPTAHSFVVDTLLAASELVSNALEHTSGICRLRSWYTPVASSIRVEVEDDEPPPGTRLGGMPDANRPGGRGLAIVAAVASRWGMDPVAGGKIVWFELEG